MHKRLLEKAVEVMSGFEEASKLVAYGSVIRGNPKPDSDIDIAFICDDIWRGLPLDSEGFPIGLRKKVEQALEKIPHPEKIVFHIPFYWESEFEQGIELYSGRSPPRLLNDIGLVVYEYSDN